MNKIVKVGTEYYLETESGVRELCTVIFEKKTGKNYIRLPKDNESGRVFISQKFVDVKGEYTFDTKTTEPRVLGSSSKSVNWKSTLTEKEKIAVEKAEKIIEEIKTIALTRVPSESDILKEKIAKLQKQLDDSIAKSTKPE